MVSLTVILFLDFNPVLGEKWILYNVTQIGVNIGNNYEGNVSSLLDIDGDTFKVSEVVGTPGWEISINWTVINQDAGCFAILIYEDYTGDKGHDIDISLYNFTGSSWMDIGNIYDVSGFEWVNVTVYEIREPVDFLDGSGAVLGRIRHESSGNKKHEILFEYIKLNALLSSQEEDPPNVEPDYPWIAVTIILCIISGLLFTKVRR